ncbi:acriflavine sensitivity control protein acr-2 [Ophiocordyceps camponoti-floridani]|uniref:Acriflavine sensitivity control protein acr-2 n=1 Tax=Ophiocordyceps camponoti-floridani TaxID=2030778 RepID=A0A8H4Q648_9HYPO|nr:acriflavine sensitivity control protein acr-2 [Ophiocordyceps camponoti-floridani]
MEPTKISAKACHNCRRRRLRCDRSYPHCNKCIGSGKECLGYGKLFRWIGAVASRGKLAGRTSSAPLDFPKRQSSPAPPETQQLVARPRSPVFRTLVDPLYQDLDSGDRRYLAYFTRRLCKDLVARDDGNPYRDLLGLTKAHPLLRHTLVAASATHMCNLVRLPLCRRAVDGPPASQDLDDVSRWAYRHALSAKLEALGLMRDAIQNINADTGDVVLTSILFLFTLELIESGKHGWKAHLRAAIQILSVLQPALPRYQDMRNLMLYDSLVYLVMGSAFLPEPLVDVAPLFQPSKFSDMVARAAAHSYICCPGPILGILYEASQLSNAAGDDTDAAAIHATGLALIRRAQEFDVEAWAGDDANFSALRLPSVQTRTHAGFAHRLAVCLYTMRAIPSLCSHESIQNSAKMLTEGIIRHVSAISSDDPNFKVVTWPTFVVGAESTSPATRDWAARKLDQLASTCPWGFLHTALEALHRLWGMESSEMESGCWVKKLKESEFHFLVV